MGNWGSGITAVIPAGCTLPDHPASLFIEAGDRSFVRWRGGRGDILKVDDIGLLAGRRGLSSKGHDKPEHPQMEEQGDPDEKRKSGVTP
ncbi:MAG: hypothetical protein Fur0034_13780 [Desulfuromonadia bacterium]